MWPEVTADLRAETIVQVRRPAHWLLVVTAVTLTLAFGYLTPYAGANTERVPEQRPAAMLPSDSAAAAIGGLPLFVGSLALIFGVLVTGSDYAWETWKTVLVQQPSRMSVLAGKVAVLAAGTLLLVVTLLGACAAASYLVAGLEGASAGPPTLHDLALDASAGWLIAFMWSLCGAALSVLMRAVVLPVGIGLVWMLGVQNLISAVAAPLLEWLDDFQRWMPGPAAGSLVAGLTDRTDTPGVQALTGTGNSAAILFGYVVLCLVLCAVPLARRDVV
jgi:ABC-2 type transport system permease protein